MVGKKYWLGFLACMFFYGMSFSQNPEVEKEEVKVRPFRIGVKIGVPNLVGGNLEYVTPLFRDRLALSLDYSAIKTTNLLGMDEIEFGYLGGGLNYYFFKPGKGLYGGVTYGNLIIEGMLSGIESEDDPGKTGEGTANYSHNSYGVKIGAKWGGLFYFRPEIGYSFDPLPKFFDAEVVFSDGSREAQKIDFVLEESPLDLLFAGWNFNIGFGFSF